MRRAQGLTLIEVLVVSTLLVVLLGLISQFFAVQARAASLQKALNEANEATRTVLTLITWDLQNAGYKVMVSNENKALDSYNSGHTDIVTSRFFDVSASPSAPKKVRYSLGKGDGEVVTSMRRAYYGDPATSTFPQATPPSGSNGPSIASVVALNLRFETRTDPFKTPTSGTCPANTTSVPLGATGAAITNCSVNWSWQDIPSRLVRRVRLQVLGRSETRVTGYLDRNLSYVFEGVSQYTTEPGFVYHFAEQTVLVPNLGR